MSESVVEAHRLLTIDEFDRAWAAGVYGPEEKLELIEGEVYCKMSPQESEHATGVRAGEEALRSVFGKGYDVRGQLPLEYGLRSKPEPDISVVVGSFRDYAKRQPTTAVLVIEISDTTLAFDRTTKAALYARAGIEDYWIVNLRDRVIEVHRQPALLKESSIEHGYLSVTSYTESDSVTPLAMPSSTINVSDLLP